MSSTRINSPQPFPHHTAQELFHYLMNQQCERENKLRLLQIIEKWPGAENLFRATLELAKAARFDAMYLHDNEGLTLDVTYSAADEQHIAWVIKNLRLAIQCARVERKGYADDASTSSELFAKPTHATNHDYQSFLMWRQKKVLRDEQVLAGLVSSEIKLGR